MPPAHAVERAIRLSYTQMMLNAVFAASTGGMFLVGFAMDLGASNIVLGLMSSVPQLFVVFQLLAAWLVEQGYSRRKLTIIFALVAPLCWLMIAAIPFLGQASDRTLRLTILIGTITAASLAGQFAGNARSSWIGELIPASRRGRFFGYCGMFGGLVGALFAIGEGRLLDVVRGHGLLAFAGLFFFGTLFGLASALLNIPQPDCPLPRPGVRPSFGSLIRLTCRNRPLGRLAAVHATVALSGIAGPFASAYCLRDVGLTFFQLGLLNSISTGAALIASPVWGRIVDRFGSRPIIILSLSLMAPCGAIWLGIPPHSPQRALWLLPWTNFVAGFAGAGFGVALSTMMYKATQPEGRSVQFALYGIVVALIGAPMPLVGGWLVSYLQRLGWAVDLRLTFYLWMAFMVTAAALACRLHDPESLSTRTLVFRHFPGCMAGWLGLGSAPDIAAIKPVERAGPTPRGPPADPA